MPATDFSTKLAIQDLGLLSLRKQGCITMDNTKEDTSNFLNWVENIFFIDGFQPVASQLLFE